MGKPFFLITACTFDHFLSGRGCLLREAGAALLLPRLKVLIKIGKMGRLPKGFKKTLAHKHDGPEAADEDESMQKPQGSKEGASTSKQQPSTGKHAPAPDLPPIDGGDGGDGSDDEGSQGGPESRGRMLQRHKKARNTPVCLLPHCNPYRVPISISVLVSSRR
jgi:hypothetical protein